MTVDPVRLFQLMFLTRNKDVKDKHSTNIMNNMIYGICENNSTPQKIKSTGHALHVVTKSKQKCLNLLNGNLAVDGLSVNVDCNKSNSVRLFGTASGTFKVRASCDKTNFYNLQTVYTDEDNHFSVYVPDAPLFLRIKNGAQPNSIVCVVGFN